MASLLEKLAEHRDALARLNASDLETIGVDKSKWEALAPVLIPVVEEVRESMYAVKSSLDAVQAIRGKINDFERVHGKIGHEKSGWLEYLERDGPTGFVYPPVPFDYGFSVRAKPLDYAGSWDDIGPFKDGEQPVYHDYPKSVRWYKDSPPRQFLNPSFVRLLINYGKIRGREVIAHLHDIRDQAWIVCLFPNIGTFEFCELLLDRHQSYPTVLQRLKDPAKPATFLDLGTDLGINIRQLIQDGAPAENLWACQNLPAFIDLGFQLFKDKHSLKANLFATDWWGYDDANGPLQALQGTFDIVNTNFFLDVSDYPKQIETCQKLLKLLKPIPGAMLLGKQAANRQHRLGNQQGRHDEESLEVMWEAIGELTGSRWKVTSTFREWWQEGQPEWTGEEWEYVWFSAERLDQPGEYEVNEGFDAGEYWRQREANGWHPLREEYRLLTGKKQEVVLMDFGDAEVGGADGEEEESKEEEEAEDEAADGEEADGEATNTHEQQSDEQQIEEEDLMFFDEEKELDDQCFFAFHLLSHYSRAPSFRFPTPAATLPADAAEFVDPGDEGVDEAEIDEGGEESGEADGPTAEKGRDGL
ncbi:MAG: hypothetical protein LQ350_002873 [Teloschistes chrysophthalmus]|nr:MAG: hypothetical protein LQ350_002873 [Niorma chrysophthalma]